MSKKQSPSGGTPAGEKKSPDGGMPADSPLPRPGQPMSDEEQFTLLLALCMVECVKKEHSVKQ